MTCPRSREFRDTMQDVYARIYAEAIASGERFESKGRLCADSTPTRVVQDSI